MSDDFITVRTTLPSLPIPDRHALRTTRLKLRPFRQSDLPDLHEIYKQPEVMHWENADPHTRPSQTQRVLDGYLDTTTVFNYIWAVTLRSTGELIGLVRVDDLVEERDHFPWISYKLNRRCWGVGYAKEAVGAVVEAWWALPRSPAVVMLLEKEVADLGGEPVPSCRERLLAVVADCNSRSKGVLRTLGAQMLVDSLSEEDEISEWTLELWYMEKPAS